MSTKRATLKIRKKNGVRSFLRKLRRGKLAAFVAAAMVIPGLGLGAQAQSPAEAPEIRFQYSQYQDQDSGGTDRIKIQTPEIWVRTPLFEKTEFEGGLVYDSVSGASPYYLNTLTGASGIGIHDLRRAVDGKVTHYFERFSIGAGAVVSDEDDYLSRGGSLDARIWTPDKNTVVALGVGAHADHITSSISEMVDEYRRTQEYLIGVTQVIDQRNIVQSNLTFATADGYMSDPYKPLDNRPASRDQWAWLTRHTLFFPDLGSSLHTDYRLYRDTWNLISHTLELSYYQPVGAGFTVVPLLRYYSQKGSDFYTATFPPENFERHLTADQRLASFGGITTGLKVIKDLGDGFSVDLGYAFLQQRDTFKLGSSQDTGITPLYAHFFKVGVDKKF